MSINYYSLTESLDHCCHQMQNKLYN